MIVYQNKYKSATIFINTNMFIFYDRNDFIVSVLLNQIFCADFEYSFNGVFRNFYNIF